MPSSSIPAVQSLLLLLLLPAAAGLRFAEAPPLRDAGHCPAPPSAASVCNPSDVHVAMTLDVRYLRGTIAAVHSLLRHTACPSSVLLHFLPSSSSPLPALTHALRSAFPSLRFLLHPFDPALVSRLISPSLRDALDDPLNYARVHLADLLPACVPRVVYLDSDVILADDVRKLFSVPIPAPKVLAAPEYCHVDFHRYFTREFWDDEGLRRAFAGRNPCYFNTGVMVVEMKRWRKGRYGDKLRGWMEVRRGKRIYELGSQPPFLLVFAGDVAPVDMRWNQHGLGGDNAEGRCRGLHPGGVSLLHWSGKGKPWVRIDDGRPCAVDSLWAPYDLYRRDRYLAQFSS